MFLDITVLQYYIQEHRLRTNIITEGTIEYYRGDIKQTLKDMSRHNESLVTRFSRRLSIWLIIFYLIHYVCNGNFDIILLYEVISYEIISYPSLTCIFHQLKTNFWMMFYYEPLGQVTAITDSYLLSPIQAFHVTEIFNLKGITSSSCRCNSVSSY